MARSSRRRSPTSSRIRAAYSKRRSLAASCISSSSETMRRSRSARGMPLTAAAAAGPAPGRGGGAALAAPAADGRALLLAPQGLDDVGDPLADRLGVDAVGRVPVDLELAAPVGLLDGPLHRRGHLVGVHDHLAVDVAGGPADGLDERGLRAQEALLVGVQD